MKDPYVSKTNKLLTVTRPQVRWLKYQIYSVTYAVLLKVPHRHLNSQLNRFVDLKKIKQGKKTYWICHPSKIKSKTRTDFESKFELVVSVRTLTKSGAEDNRIR